MDNNSIERKAKDIRKLCSIDTLGIPNIFALCEERGVYVVRYPISDDGFWGAAIHREDDFIILSNSKTVLSREIFTVAHELGHIVLNHINGERVISDYCSTSENEIEKEANYFAACLLMPKEKIDEYISTYEINTETIQLLEVAKMQSVFNVSFDSLILRLNELELISDNQYDYFKREKVNHQVNKLLKAVGADPDICFPQEAKYIPLDFIKWIKANYENGVIPFETLQRGLAYIELNPEDLDLKTKKEEPSFSLDEFFGGAE